MNIKATLIVVSHDELFLEEVKVSRVSWGLEGSKALRY